MERYVTAIVKPYSRVKSKQDLRDMVTKINAHEPLSEVDVTLNDAFGPLDGVTAGVSDLLKADKPGYTDMKGVTLQVSDLNRRWTATVAAENGVLVVT